MKDKMFLLNLQPFLAKNMQKISSELQSYSLTVYTAEQAKCSERAQRLTSGQASTQPPRSLIELTNESSIFAILHTHFTWILSTGARYLTENVTVGAPSVPPWIAGDEDGFSVVNMDNEEWLLHRQMADNETEDYSIRKCRELLKTDFISTCYCVLVGTQVSHNSFVYGLLSMVYSCSILIFPNAGSLARPSRKNNASNEVYA